ncbi:MAG: AMP-binding protein [Methylococcaceae bacterium]|nr:AMP-binding protein [Methylococcaceae bacterium]
MKPVNTLPQLLENRALQSPHAIAFWVRNNDKEWSSINWQAFYIKVKVLSSGLNNEGFGVGDVIAIMANTSVEWELFNQAVLAIGGVVVGLDPNELPEQLESVVITSKVKAIAVDTLDRLNKFNKQTRRSFSKVITFQTNELETEFLHAINLDELIKHNQINNDLPDIRPDDIATIVFTSGSTGIPKGIVYRHKQIVLAVNTILQTYPELSERCNLACWLPLSNLFQRMVNLSAISCGAQTYVVNHPKQIMEYLPQINPHVFFAVPRFYEKLNQALEAKLNNRSFILQYLLRFSLLTAEKNSMAGFLCEQLNYFFFQSFRSLFGCNIRYMISGSAPMPVWLLRRFQAMGLLILEAYGQSENVVPISANRRDQYRFGSVGQVLPGNEIRLAEDDELLIKGDGVFSGYLESNNKTNLDNDGYLATGDFAEIDNDGFIHLTGRKSEVFKTSTGRKIAPVFIESKIQQVKQVEHAVVFGQNKKFLIALISVNSFDIENHQNLTEYGLQFLRFLRIYIKDLPHYQKPAGIVLLRKEFSVADQELTSNLKLRRKNIQQHYATIITSLYSELENPLSKIHMQPINLDNMTLLLKL